MVTVPVFLQQQHCHRFTNNIASANYNTLFATDVYAGAGDEFHNASWCAGQKIIVTNHNLSYIDRVECIYLFLGRKIA